MSTIIPQPDKPGLESTIDDLFTALKSHDPESPEFSAINDQLTKLYALKSIDAPKRVSPDTLLLVAGNLAGIVAILSWERVNVVTSKALGLLLRVK